MYIPRSYTIDELAEQQHFIQHHPLATLITRQQGIVQADHIPMLSSEKEPMRLLGHVARANPLWQEHDAQEPVLLIFQGADAYISPNWYPSKALHGKDVPTWNYQAVHVYGRLIVHDDVVWLRDFLEKLTNQHESRFASPWQVSDAPEDYMQKMLKAIVGIEIVVERIVGKYKLSQNRQTADCQGAINGLAAQPSEKEKLLLSEMCRVNALTPE